MNKTAYSIILVLVTILAVSNMMGFYELSDRITDLEAILISPHKTAQTIEKARESVVRIIAGESEGSGFAFMKDGLILTNHHVIEFDTTPKIILPDNTVEVGRVLMADQTSDLAVVKIDRDMPAIPMAHSSGLNAAQELYGLGFALGGYIGGEATVIKGLFSGSRFKDTIVQTDMEFFHGMSGGPVVNADGEFVGVISMGLANGLGLAIASDYVIDQLELMRKSDDPIRDVEQIEFRPDLNAYEAVKAFYNYLRARRLDKAFNLLSKNFVQANDFETWTKGYSTMLNVNVVIIYPDLMTPNRVQVKLASKDFVDGEIVYQFFQGYWDVKKVDGRFTLWDPEIRRIEDPEEDWFGSKEFIKEYEAFVEAHDDYSQYRDAIMQINKERVDEKLSLKEVYDLAKSGGEKKAIHSWNIMDPNLGSEAIKYANTYK